MLDVQVPKTADHGDTPFYPSTLARGQRSSQAVLSAAAECYFLQGVSNRDVEAIFKHFGIETLEAKRKRLRQVRLCAVQGMNHHSEGKISSFRTKFQIFKPNFQAVWQLLLIVGAKSSQLLRESMQEVSRTMFFLLASYPQTKYRNRTRC